MELVDDQDVQGHLGDLVRDHHADQNQVEQEVFALELQLGKGITGQTGEYDVAQHLAGGHHKGVGQPFDAVLTEREERLVGIQTPGRREHRAVGGGSLDRRAEGVDDHVKQREQAAHCQGDQHQNDDGVAQIQHLFVVDMLGIQTTCHLSLPLSQYSTSLPAILNCRNEIAAMTMVRMTACAHARPYLL